MTAVSGWSLRRKVALTLAIPLVLAATLGGLRVIDNLSEAADSSSSAQQVTVLRPAVEFLTAAEHAMVMAQKATEVSRADLELAVEDIQENAAWLEQTRDSAELTPEQVNQVDVVLDLSAALRDDNTKSLSPDTWIAQLRQLQSGVTQLITTIVNEQNEPEPRLEQLSQVLAGRFSLAMQQALVATDRSGDTGSLELFSELGVEGAAIDRLAAAMGDSQPEILALRTDNGQRNRTVRTGGDSLGGDEAYTDYDALITQLMDGIDDELAANAGSAQTKALVNAIITLLALLAAILLALMVSRLLINPIRKVREGALNVAHEQLPEAVARIRAGEEPGEITPIDVTTHEEVGQLARAVEDLHRQAVVLASGEAKVRAQVGEMFVTLSRRSTSLINQQLNLIETLEKDEEDPKRLESLFRLDHLAARMRRSADSLLILADAPPRPLGHTDVTVGELLQAATAGVQDYARVRVWSNLRTRISDGAAGDVVHLLTELVDNALSYSAPTTTVTLDATPGTHGVTIEVSDTGLGMEDDQLRAINETLRSGGDITPDTARRMGLFVVSRLAKRYGISASLARNEDNGITATVVLPASILPDLAPLAGPEPVVAEEEAPLPEPVTKEEQVPQPVVEHVSPRDDAPLTLPTRQPGATTERPGLPVRSSGTGLLQAQPEAAPVEVAPEPVVPAVPEPVALKPEPEPEPAAPVAEEVHVPVAAATDVLDAPLVSAESGDDEGGIFSSMRSSWLKPDAPKDDSWRTSEIEQGWQRADKVAEATAETEVTAAGLPVRRPGARLVPGGVAIPAVVATRNADAIRARLAAHAAGVSRGRSATTTPDHTEAGPA